MTGMTALAVVETKHQFGISLVVEAGHGGRTEYSWTRNRSTRKAIYSAGEYEFLNADFSTTGWEEEDPVVQGETSTRTDLQVRGIEG